MKWALSMLESVMLDFSLMANSLNYLEANLQNAVDIRRTNECSVTGVLPQGEFGEVHTFPGDPQKETNRVYFMYCAGMVKIGHTNRVTRRFSEIKISTPFHADIVLMVPGGRQTEAYIHFVFKKYHIKGEWFELGPRLRETIERLAPDFCLDWLKEDEEAHRDWIADERPALRSYPRSIAGGVNG